MNIIINYYYFNENVVLGMSIYKKQLQISLKKEKADHQQMKIDKDLKFNEEKMKSEKIINEAKNKFNSLQQHFNLLQVTVKF